ncbi:MAG: class I SAM-dependent methyltransferase [Alphaproteobacteria bacterium]|nr:class I SAM-dependent methyltransferase [Alphaproteobacteria bacterium]
MDEAPTLAQRARAEAYARGPGWRYDPAYRRIAGALALTEGALLDIGCGPGLVCVHAAAGHPELDCVGIDTNPAMIRLARRSAGRRLNCTFRVMDGAAIRYPAATFHRVVAVQTMHHWTDPDAVLAEIHRVLRPGGIAMLHDADPSAEIDPAFVRRRGRWPPDLWLRQMWRRDSLGDAGFEDMLERTRRLAWADVGVDTLGFYRRIVARR